MNALEWTRMNPLGSGSPGMGLVGHHAVVTTRWCRDQVCIVAACTCVIVGRWQSLLYVC